MFTRIIRLLQKNRRPKVFFLTLCFTLLSFYPVFRSFYYGNGILSYERHIAWLEKRSPFYNPWQYRVLSPLLVEGTLWVYNHTIDKIYPVEEKVHVRLDPTSPPTDVTRQMLEVAQQKDALKYLIVFIGLRFAEHFLIFLLAYSIWSRFVRNDWLLFFALIFLALSMGNAVAAADLTLNTYLDIILYLLTACTIVYRKNPVWLIPIIIVGAFNRETSLMIPFLYFVSAMDFRQVDWRSFRLSAVRFPTRRIWALTAIEYVLFFGIFLAIRYHYGYRPPQVWKAPAGWPMLKLNLFSAVGFKALFEMIGTFGVIPLIILYRFRQFPYMLRLWFIAVVPAWFLVHLITVVSYQTRLFLVPEILIFMPMMLWLIEKRGREEASLPALIV